MERFRSVYNRIMSIVTIEVPDFPEDDMRCLRVMFGIEERAKKYPNRPWEVKTAQCNMCGKCCHDVVDNWEWGKNPETGACAHLVYNAGWDNGTTKLGWMCDFGTARPTACSVGDEASEDHCSVIWEKIS